MNYFADRHGTQRFPILLQAADGPGTVTFLGGLNLKNVRFLYLKDLNLRAGNGDPLFSNNVLHIEDGGHILLKNLVIAGPDPKRYPDNYDVQEVVKVNQSEYIYLENSDVYGAYQTILDFFAVQHGHLVGNRFHASGEWCAYLKGGSAYFRVEENQFYDCGLGFQAGEGSNFEVMRAPWLQYEATGISVVHNTFHNISGTGLSVAGGYNILFAFNTLYNVGTLHRADGTGWPLFQAVHGRRGCIETEENGRNNAADICGGYLRAGGWGTAGVGESFGGEYIPNKHVYVYNNVFYNPTGSSTLYSHFGFQPSVIPPAHTQNIPSPSRVDDDLVLRGNVIWNGPTDHPLGIEGDACMTANPTCNEAQIRRDNAINQFEPQLQNPTRGDFTLVPQSRAFSTFTASLPAFSWSDLPSSRPSIPLPASGELSIDLTSQTGSTPPLQPQEHTPPQIQTQPQINPLTTPQPLVSTQSAALIVPAPTTTATGKLKGFKKTCLRRRTGTFCTLSGSIQVTAPSNARVNGLVVRLYAKNSKAPKELLLQNFRFISISQGKTVTRSFRVFLPKNSSQAVFRGSMGKNQVFSITTP